MLADVTVPVMQSSANRSGGADPRSLDEVDDAVRDGADLVVDGGTLPGTPSTVIDLRAYGSHGTWSVVREGAVARRRRRRRARSDAVAETGCVESCTRSDTHSTHPADGRARPESAIGARRYQTSASRQSAVISLVRSSFTVTGST